MLTNDLRERVNVCRKKKSKSHTNVTEIAASLLDTFSQSLLTLTDPNTGVIVLGIYMRYVETQITK